MLCYNAYMCMFLFCNNLLTKFPVGALAAPASRSDREVIFVSVLQDVLWDRQAEPPASGRALLSCRFLPFSQGLAAAATTAASAATGTVIATSLGPGPAPGSPANGVACMPPTVAADLGLCVSYCPLGYLLCSHSRAPLSHPKFIYKTQVLG